MTNRARMWAWFSGWVAGVVSVATFDALLRIIDLMVRP